MTSSTEFQIWFASLLGIYSFTALIPYIIDMLNLMKPSMIIQQLSKELTKKNINNFVRKHSDDPMQPIMDILFRSLMKYDYGTIREGLTKLEETIYDIFNEGFEKSEDDVAIHVFDQLSIFSDFSEKINKDKTSALKLIYILQENGSKAALQNLEGSSLKSMRSIFIIGKSASNNKLKTITNSSIDAIILIGEKSAKKQLLKATYQSIHYLEILGIISASKIWYDSTEKTINGLEKIGLTTVENNLEKHSRQSLYSLSTIGVTSASQNLERLRRQTIKSIEKIGIEYVNKGCKKTSEKAVYWIIDVWKSGKINHNKLNICTIKALKSMGIVSVKKNLSKTTELIVTKLLNIGMEVLNNEKILIKTLYAIEKILENQKSDITFSEDSIKKMKHILVENKDKFDHYEHITFFFNTKSE